MSRAVGLMVLSWMLIAAGATTNAAPSDSANGQGPSRQGETINVTVIGVGGVPEVGVEAVALNVTATGPTSASYLTVYPTGASRPTASNLNFVAGQTVPNMVIATVGADGQVSIFNSQGDVNVVVDVLGWFPIGSGFNGLVPARLLDTRPGEFSVPGGSTGAVGPGEARRLMVAGRGGVPAGGVGAVALNVTATEPSSSGYLTVFPSGAERPTASNVNFVAQETSANMVLAQVGSDGAVSVFNYSGSTHVVVDVLGWFPIGSGFNGLVPARLLDTRQRPASSTLLLPNRGNAEVSTDAVGRHVAFSTAEGLDPRDTNGQYDVYVLDRASGATRLLSARIDGAQGGNAWSRGPKISGDGRFVIFVSFASDLVAGDTNGGPDLFKFDLVTGVLSKVTFRPDGGPFVGHLRSYGLSDDGRVAVYGVLANPDQFGISPPLVGAYMFDAETQTTTSIRSGWVDLGSDGPFRPQYQVALDASGRFAITWAPQVPTHFHDLVSGSSREIAGPADIAALSDDGRSALVVEGGPVGPWRQLVVDTETGRAHPVEPDVEYASFEVERPRCVDADGTGRYVLLGYFRTSVDPIIGSGLQLVRYDTVRHSTVRVEALPNGDRMNKPECGQLTDDGRVAVLPDVDEQLLYAIDLG